MRNKKFLKTEVLKEYSTCITQTGVLFTLVMVMSLFASARTSLSFLSTLRGSLLFRLPISSTPAAGGRPQPAPPSPGTLRWGGRPRILRGACSQGLCQSHLGLLPALLESCLRLHRPVLSSAGVSSRHDAGKSRMCRCRLWGADIVLPRPCQCPAVEGGHGGGQSWK